MTDGRDQIDLKLGALLREHSTDAPSSDIDAAILAAATKLLVNHSEPRRVRFYETVRIGSRKRAVNRATKIRRASRRKPDVDPGRRLGVRPPRRA